MTEQRLRARSATEIVDAAFQLYRQDTIEYIAAAAIAYVPWLVIQLVIVLWSGRAMNTNPGAAIGILVVSVVGTMVVYALMTGVIARLASDAYLGRTATLEIVAAVRDVLPRVGTLIGAAIMKYLLIIAAGGVVGVLGGLAVVGAPVSWRIAILIALYILAMAAAIYVAVRYFATTPIIVLERESAFGSFSRSLTLTRARGWHVFFTMLLVWFIYFVCFAALAFGASLLHSPLIVAAAITVYTIAAYPLMGLVGTVLYYDTRIRGEGFDLEVMARGLQPAAGT